MGSSLTSFHTQSLKQYLGTHPAQQAPKTQPLPAPPAQGSLLPQLSSPCSPSSGLPDPPAQRSLLPRLRAPCSSSSALMQEANILLCDKDEEQLCYMNAT